MWTLEKLNAAAKELWYDIDRENGAGFLRIFPTVPFSSKVTSDVVECREEVILPLPSKTSLEYVTQLGEGMATLYNKIVDRLEASLFGKGPDGLLGLEQGLVEGNTFEVTLGGFDEALSKALDKTTKKPVIIGPRKVNGEIELSLLSAKRAYPNLVTLHSNHCDEKCFYVVEATSWRRVLLGEIISPVYYDCGMITEYTTGEVRVMMESWSQLVCLAPGKDTTKINLLPNLI